MLTLPEEPSCDTSTEGFQLVTREAELSSKKTELVLDKKTLLNNLDSWMMVTLRF